MTLATGSKRQIVDYLWEWAYKKGSWALLLVDKIVSHACIPSEAELDTLFDYFLQDLQLTTGLPALNISKPVFAPRQWTMQISSLILYNITYLPNSINHYYNHKQ